MMAPSTRQPSLRPAVMNVEDARGLRHMWQLEDSRFAERDPGVVVARLPMLLHPGTGEFESLARRFKLVRLVLQLHDGRDLDARFLYEELHVRIPLTTIGELIQES